MSARELAPCRGITRATWTPVEQQSERSSLSGDEDVLELGEPYWEVDIDVTLPTRDDFDLWQSFIARRRGSQVTFTMPRTFRSKPRDTSITSDAGLGVSAYNEESSVLTLSGATDSSCQLGDMISYRTAANGYYIGSVLTANGSSGSTLNVPIWPRPVEPHATTPDPHRINAVGEFRLDGKPKWSESNRRRSLKFKAVQVLL